MGFLNVKTSYSVYKNCMLRLGKYMMDESLAGGPWVVWTTWNESTQSLNGGHYDIKTYEDALSICEARRK